MQRRWNKIIGAGLTLGLLGITQLAVAARTYYVDATIGDDTYSEIQAQNSSTPWRTIKKAVNTGGLATMAQNGAPAEAYTVIVKAGTYPESVESKRDGLADAPVTIKAASVGTATIRTSIGHQRLLYQPPLPHPGRVRRHRRAHRPENGPPRQWRWPGRRTGGAEY